MSLWIPVCSFSVCTLEGIGGHVAASNQDRDRHWKILQSGNVHQPIAKGDDHGKGDETRWDTAREEVADLEVSLAGLRDFSHDGSW